VKEVVVLKRSVLLGCCVLLFASVAFAQFIEITLPVETGLDPALVPPITTYRWETAAGSSDPDSVRWIVVLRDESDTWEQAEDYIRNNPDAPEWSDWHYYRAPDDSGKFWVTPPMDFGYYVFAVHGKDADGNVGTVFDLTSNMRRMLVSTRTTGPTLTVTSASLPHPIESARINTPVTRIELTEGTPVQFCFTADASSYGGIVRGYRYGWDLTDPEDDTQWDIDWTPFVGPLACSPVKTFFFGVHTFYVEALDNSGFRSRVPVEITYTPAPPAGDGGSIGIFSDTNGSDCNVYDLSGPTIARFYVVHVGQSGALAARFSAPPPPCFSTAIYVQDLPVFFTTEGNTQTGVEVQYTTSSGAPSCKPSPVHVMTIEYVVQGLTAPCCYYSVLPYPGDATIEVTDCFASVLSATGGEAIINPQSGCSCSVSTRTSTWGAVKAMFR